MTVPAKIPADTHVGNGVTTQFSYSFLCFDKDDFKVFIDLVLVDPADYAVSGLGSATGGLVTLSAAPADGASVILRLDVVLDRQTNYQHAGDFLSQVVNRDFDRLWLSQQSQQVDLNAAVRFPPGESVSFLPAVNTRKGKALVFDPVTGAPKPSVDDYNDQAANAAASAAAADQAKQDAQTAAGNSSNAADAAAQSAIDAANAAASVDPQSLSTDHYGPTAPSTTWPGMTWADSGTNTLWRRNSANSGWVNEGVLFRRSLPGATFAEVAALTADEGPVICTDHGGAMYVWNGTAYAPLIADETYAGAVKRATTAQAQGLTDDTTALTPKKLADVMNQPKWLDVTASRAFNTVYTNTTGRPKVVQIIAFSSAGGTILLEINSASMSLATMAANYRQTVSAVVPAGATYKASMSLGTITSFDWMELL